MKVYYPGPGRKTYHPKLGKLIADQQFELADGVAKTYVKGGLLKEAKKAHSSQLIAESKEPKE